MDGHVFSVQRIDESTPAPSRGGIVAIAGPFLLLITSTTSCDVRIGTFKKQSRSYTLSFKPSLSSVEGYWGVLMFG